jgi:hypothetical protein
VISDASFFIGVDRLPGRVSESAGLWDRVALEVKRITKSQTRTRFSPRISLPSAA